MFANFLDIWCKYLKSIRGENIILHSQYHYFGCAVDAMSQGISSNGILPDILK